MDRAARCTLSFAAMELKQYLKRTLNQAEIMITSEPDEGSFLIELDIERVDCNNENFTLTHISKGIRITGEGRVGTLYGAYEYLRLQGWRWYAPDLEGEISPKKTDVLNFPESVKKYEPAMRLGRGFDFEGVLKESEDLWIWMARNRLNVATYRSATAPLLHKLGMSLKVGGHIFENMLSPEIVLPSGKTLWEEHEDWYGLPQNKVKEKDKALLTQFCVSQNDLLEFLCEELLSYAMGEWKEADRIDVWNFDTWGSTCSCAACNKLGNSTDKNLYFLSVLRNYFNQAELNGGLDHKVELVLCSYEGTATIQPPEKPVPVNLLIAGDYVVFYPILRCYAHSFNDKACSYNTFYETALSGWLKNDIGIPVVVGEYYNVSKFEDLPLLFTKRICEDIPYYHKIGVKGMTYMHLPMINWGMRTLTQLLYAQLTWNPNIDIENFLQEYFANWYGEYAKEMEQVYLYIEEAWVYSANWRAWGTKSILTHMMSWNGRRPTEPLGADDHFQTPEGVVSSGRKSISKLQEAIEELDDVRHKDKIQTAMQTFTGTQVAINPVELQKLQQGIKYEHRLGEDRRLLLYGLDTMLLMTEMVEYYNALYAGNETEAVAIWSKIEELEDKLDSYFMPLTFGCPKVKLISKDALTRTQLREVICRCRKYRLTQRL